MKSIWASSVFLCVNVIVLLLLFNDVFIMLVYITCYLRLQVCLHQVVFVKNFAH